MTEIIAGVFIPDSAMACEGMHFMELGVRPGQVVACQLPNWRQAAV